MRKRWLIRGILACAAFLGSAHLAQAQATGSSSGVGTTTGGGSSSSSGSNAGIGTTTAAGTTGQGISSLGSGTNSGRSSSGSSSSVTPQASDPFQTYYSNPYAIGVAGVATSFTTTSSGGITGTIKGTGFGTPVYATTTSRTTTTGASSSTTINTGGFSSLNMLKNHPYATVLAKSVPIVTPPPAQLQSDLLSSLKQSDFLKDKREIFLKVDGSTVYLKGQVANNDERRLVEGFIRMSPSVRNVVNELVSVATSNE